MKNVKNPLTVLILSVLILSSCSIEKRLYNRGYHVEWKSHKVSGPEKQSNDHDVSIIEAIQPEKQQIIEIRDNQMDVAIMDNEYDEPVTVETNIIESIATVSNTSSVIPVNNPEVKSTSTTKEVVSSKAPKKSPAPEGTRTKSWVIALLLCWLLGFLGFHRFYLGYTGMGFLFLFTLGFLGIGILIDLIRIIIKDLKPKNGDYN